MTDIHTLDLDPGKDETVLITRKVAANSRFHRTVDGETPVCGSSTNHEKGWRDVELVVLRGHYTHCGKCTEMIEDTWTETCTKAQR